MYKLRKGCKGQGIYWSQVWVEMGAHQTDISTKPRDIHTSMAFVLKQSNRYTTDIFVVVSSVKWMETFLREAATAAFCHKEKTCDGEWGEIEFACF